MSNDGGPAFPDPPIEHAGYWYNGTSGMSLLDYFAGQALANSSICHINQSPGQAARMAYVQAEAMLSYKQNQQLAAESQQVALGIGGQT